MVVTYDDSGLAESIVEVLQIGPIHWRRPAAVKKWCPFVKFLTELDMIGLFLVGYVCSRDACNSKSIGDVLKSVALYTNC